MLYSRYIDQEERRKRGLNFFLYCTIHICTSCITHVNAMIGLDDSGNDIFHAPATKIHHRRVTTPRRMNSINFLYVAGLRPGIGHHYRGHKMSIWLNLIPQLHKTGRNAIFPSHNSLALDDGDNWSAIVRNASLAATDKNAAMKKSCMTLAESHQVLFQHNDTLVRIEEASKYAYSYVLVASVGLGAIFCVINAAILVCICQRRHKLLRDSSPRHSNSHSRGDSPLTEMPTATMEYFPPSPPHHNQHHQHRVIADISGAVRHHELQQPNSMPTMAQQQTPRGGQRTLLVQPQPPPPPTRTAPPLRSALRTSGSYACSTSSTSSDPAQRPGSALASSIASPMATVKARKCQNRTSDTMALEAIPAPPAEFDAPQQVEELLITTHFRHQD